jgi:hypothetical protein
MERLFEALKLNYNRQEKDQELPNLNYLIAAGLQNLSKRDIA